MLNAAVNWPLRERIDRPVANMTACKTPCFSLSDHFQMRSEDINRSQHLPPTHSHANPSPGDATSVSVSAIIDRSIKRCDIMLRLALADEAYQFWYQ